MLKKISSENPPAIQMRIRVTATVVIVAAILLAVSLSGLTRRKSAEGKESRAHAQAATRIEAAGLGSMQSLRQQFGKWPLAFEVNEGQTDSSVAFLSRGSGYTVWLTKSEAVFGFHKEEMAKPDEHRDSRRSSGADGRQQRQAALRLSLLGANPTAAISGEEELAQKSNYLMGSDRSRWKQGIASFGRVRYHAVYPGVDLVYYGNQQQLEYDFALAPHADASQIRLRLRGSERVQISADGDLAIATAAGPVV
ncbi:MAG: hypothetical protein LAO30_19000, partial [Acidobacteriia bacterium]|nr:hypothetical protein [Terriglobia bacterium]